MMRPSLLLACLALAACGTKDSGPTAAPTGTATGTGSTTSTPTGGTPTGTNTCELGLSCNPIPVNTFPFTDSRSTDDAPGSEVDTYGCAPNTDESGGEWFYAVDVPERGILSMRLESGNTGGVDVDVHLLEDIDPNSCVNRDHIATSWVVDAGTWIATVDTWVNSSGVAQSGAYEVVFDFVPLASGRCALDAQELRMFWDQCDPQIDCRIDGTDVLLQTPSVGPVVKEAHLVTTAESFGGNGWPTSFTDQIDRHYSISESTSGYAMSRTEPWAPDGEGGSEFGQGATGAPIPPEHEAWYVNMYWRDRPARGTRMILFHPITGDAVVAAAGYETGPGSNESIGGAVEEIHHALGTGHRDDLVMGFAVDQTLPFGPIDCSQ